MILIMYFSTFSTRNKKLLFEYPWRRYYGLKTLRMLMDLIGEVIINIVQTLSKDKVDTFNSWTLSWWLSDSKNKQQHSLIMQWFHPELLQKIKSSLPSFSAGKLEKMLAFVDFLTDMDIYNRYLHCTIFVDNILFNLNDVHDLGK